MKSVLVALILLVCSSGKGQSKYTVANAHSHNDYEQEFPFWRAYNQGFGSIEVDIYLHNGELIVAHDSAQLMLNRRLDSLYLFPVVYSIEKNGNRIYADSTRRLQLMIDIKSDAIRTLNRLVEKLDSFKTLISNPTVQIVISGNRPDPIKFSEYPTYIFFDGELSRDYPATTLVRVVMMSDNFKRYSSWNGKRTIPAADRAALQAAITKAHSLNKKVRFWNAPDNMRTWILLQKMGVDFINTDKIEALSKFLRR